MNLSTNDEMSERHRRPEIFGDLLVLLGLTGFTITESLLAIFGSNPALFYFHNIDDFALIGSYAVIVALLPALLLWSSTLLAGQLHEGLGKAVHYLIVAFLSALWMVQFAKWTLGLEQAGVLAVCAVVGGTVSLLVYIKSVHFKYILKICALIPVIAIAVFLLSSETGSIAATARMETSQSAVDEQLPSVLFIMLDELPTMSLLNEDDIIDAGWFPHLNELSQQAAWYRHFSVLATQTKFSIPSLLTGATPRNQAASDADFSHNLFVLLAPTHHLTVFETLTGLCALPQCGEGPPGAPIEQPQPEMLKLLSKTKDLWLQRVSVFGTTVALRDDFQEKITTVPASPGNKDANEKKKSLRSILDPAKQVGFARAKPQRIDKFIKTFTPDRGPALYFIHLEMPHSPWRFYGSGQLYDLPFTRTPYTSANNDGGAWLAQLTEYRYMMQAQYTDRLLGEVFSRLKVLGMWEDMLVIVTADHGRSFKPNTDSRRLSSITIDGIAYSPLLIKRPNQDQGLIDDSNLMSHDLLPTIADILDIKVPWMPDGVPVGHPKLSERGDDKIIYPIKSKNWFKASLGEKVMFSDGEHFPEFSSRSIGSMKNAADTLTLLNRELGLDRFIGHRPSEFNVVAGGTVRVEELENLRTPPSDRAPLGVVIGNLQFEPAGDRVLVSVNGLFVTGSPLVDFQNISNTFIAMLPVGVLSDQNEIGVFLVEDNQLVELRLD